MWRCAVRRRTWKAFQNDNRKLKPGLEGGALNTTKAPSQQAGGDGSQQLARKLQHYSTHDEQGEAAAQFASADYRHTPTFSQQQHQQQGGYPAVPQRQRATSSAARPSPSVLTEETQRSSGTSWQLGELLVVEDDDVILETPQSLLMPSEEEKACASRRLAAARELRCSPARLGEQRASRVGQDVVDLVTDAFTAQREAEVKKRRQVLYELTHPNPVDYTYNKKLVPPPPLSFGKVTEEAIRLGEEIMIKPNYSLVNQAGTRVDTATASSSSTLTNSVDDANMIEVDMGKRHKKKVTASPHHGRRREDNVFRNHNFFFEINEMYQEIVMVGKACAGKSSLINALLGQPVAKTSSTPNTTRRINFYQSVTPEQLHAFHEREHHNMVKLPGGGLQLTFVDMPGFGIEGMSDKWRDAAIELTDAYFGVRRSVNTVLFCIECDRGLTKTDIKYFEWLENVQGVFYVVLTKCDDVPHSRVCSVMRQIYVLITKNRKKYRKVFPFIIPTSAKDGTNIDMLRGLITETSGMIPGDRLRDLLRDKKESAMHEALRLEARRVEEAKRLQREHAKQHFLSNYYAAKGLSAPMLGDASSSSSAYKDDGEYVSVPSTHGNTRTGGERNSNNSGGILRREVRLALPQSEGPTQKSPTTTTTTTTTTSDKSVDGFDASGDDTRQQRQNFIAWRQQNPLERTSTPYGDVRYRLNTGLENPLTDSVNIAYDGDDGEDDPAAAAACPHTRVPAARDDEDDDAGGPHPQPPLPTRGISAPPQSRVLGLGGEAASSSEGGGAFAADAKTSNEGGVVSKYLDTLAAFEQHTRAQPSPRAAHRERALLRRARQHGQAPAAPFVAEDETGRLAAFRGGKRCGPSLIDVSGPVATRQSAWKAQQLKALLQKESREMPWAAMHALSKKVDDHKQQALMSGMKPKEIAAYERNAGRITSSFEKFEGEVTAAKYANEVRQTKTLRSQQQMHLNATAKINYRSMPPGLWRQYGGMDSYWPTGRVAGRQHDESHTQPF